MFAALASCLHVDDGKVVKDERVCFPEVNLVEIGEFKVPGLVIGSIESALEKLRALSLSFRSRVGKLTAFSDAHNRVLLGNASVVTRTPRRYISDTGASFVLTLAKDLGDEGQTR